MPNIKEQFKYALDTLVNPNISIEKFSDKQLNLDIALSYGVIHRILWCSIGFLCIYQILSIIIALMVGDPANLLSSIIITFINLITTIPIYHIIRNRVGPDKFSIAEVLMRIRMLSRLLDERKARKS